MAKIGLRFLRAQKIEEPGATGCLVHLFELAAHIEQEGNRYAGCIEGFDGAIEAVGETEETVVQDLFDGFSMLVDYHIKRNNLEQFLREHGKEIRTLDKPVVSTPMVGVDRVFEYMPNIAPILGGIRVCHAG